MTWCKVLIQCDSLQSWMRGDFIDLKPLVSLTVAWQDSTFHFPIWNINWCHLNVREFYHSLFLFFFYCEVVGNQSVQIYHHVWLAAHFLRVSFLVWFFSKKSFFFSPVLCFSADSWVLVMFMHLYIILLHTVLLWCPDYCFIFPWWLYFKFLCVFTVKSKEGTVYRYCPNLVVLSVLELLPFLACFR